MTTRNQTILVIFFAAYLFTVLFTDISLVGFWTDIIFSILLSQFALRIVFRKGIIKSWLTVILKISTVFLSAIVFGLIAYSFTNMFILDTFKMRSFYYQKVNGRIFHAYFKPVGAYAGGYGNFWITESPKYFPVIEKRIYYDRTVHWNFNDDTWEGQPVDNYEMVRNYIKDEIIDKGK
ncbi:hypothetical protein [Ferruginibacter sp. SUN106]|uniref:hypothetical protein n=1 Tax=Ferruginibacter sp. SUN106 TaxID=2978348 RepID=UPI003D3672F2